MLATPLTIDRTANDTTNMAITSFTNNIDFVLDAIAFTGMEYGAHAHCIP